MTSTPCFHHRSLYGWGRTRISTCEVCQPTSIAGLIATLSATGEQGVISRGCGRSYGDVSTNHEGRVVDMTLFNKVEQFDRKTGIIICEAGVTMASLVSRFLQQGYVPPVCPGTGLVTVGGAVAHDVHGKNHEKHGSFGNHVKWIDLLLPSGELRRISRKQSQELLRATIGGAGLTGIIVRVAFEMIHIGTNAVVLKEQQIGHLDQFMDVQLEVTGDYIYTVGWIDAAARGARLGRGILLAANPAEQFLPVRKRRNINIPFNMPPGLLNPLSVRFFNFFYYHRTGKERTRHVDFERFVFPLDALLNWNRLYGTRGVYQFQCVIPHENARSTITAMLKLTADSGLASPLAVLKSFSSDGEGLLSFPRKGFTLALDFPTSRRSFQLLKRLYSMTLDNGGRIYLAKDSCMDPKQFRQMYPQADAFGAILRDIDPGGILQSDMSRRIGLHQARL